MPGKIVTRSYRGRRIQVYRRRDGALKIGKHRYARRDPSRDAKIHAHHHPRNNYYAHAGDFNTRQRTRRNRLFGFQ